MYLFNSFSLSSTAIFNFTQSLLRALTLILLHDSTTPLFSSALDPTLISGMGISLMLNQLFTLP